MTSNGAAVVHVQRPVLVVMLDRFLKPVRDRTATMTNEMTSGHLEMCWRVFEGSSTRILTCSIFSASTAGVELRVGYVVGDLPLHSQIVADIESARALAQDWLDAMRQGSDVSQLGERHET
jgi:hypothetical protein